MEPGFGRIEQPEDGARDRAMGETSQISHLEKTLLSRQPRTVPPTLWPWYHLRFCGRRWFPRQQISEYWVNLVILTTGGKGGKVTDTMLTFAIRRLRRGHE